MKPNTEKKPDVYSDKIGSPGWTYFVNIKQSSVGSYYLMLSENSRNKEGTFERHRVLIFNQDIDSFINSINCAHRELQTIRKSKGNAMDSSGSG